MHTWKKIIMDVGSERSRHKWNIQCDIHVKEFNNSLVKIVMLCLVSLGLQTTWCNYISAALSSLGKLRDGPLEKWWGEGNFQIARIFFCAHYLCTIFFPGETLCKNFFFRQIVLFSQWNLDSLSIFVLYKLFYTHSRSKDAGHFFYYVWKIFSKIYWEEEVTLSWPLPCAFL